MQHYDIEHGGPAEEEGAMRIEDYEELIRIEEEELSDDLFGLGYAELTPQLRAWIRTQAVDKLLLESRPDVAAAA